MSEEQYISFEEAEDKLGVTRATLHYYMRELKIERYKFPLDKRAYMKLSDFERIQAAKGAASRRSGPTNGDQAAKEESHAKTAAS